MSEKKLKIELNKIFKNLKIKKNDKVFMHSNSAGILQYYNNKKSFNIFWKFLNKKIGPKGCVIFPAYNYSNLKKKNLYTGNRVQHRDEENNSNGTTATELHAAQ